MPTPPDWLQKMDQAGELEDVKNDVLRALRMRGQPSQVLDPKGQPHSITMYRDMEVTIRHYPCISSNLPELYLVNYPRFEEVVFALSGPMKVATQYQPGNWMSHIASISSYPRTHWSEILPIDRKVPGHWELLQDILEASGMLAMSLGSKFTNSQLPSLQTGIQLWRTQLDTLVIEQYLLLDKTPMYITITESGRKLLAMQVMKTSEGRMFPGFCQTLVVGTWIDRVFKAYEELEKEFSSTNKQSNP